jgi:hypothetical protein
MRESRNLRRKSWGDERRRRKESYVFVCEVAKTGNRRIASGSRAEVIGFVIGIAAKNSHFLLIPIKTHAFASSYKTKLNKFTLPPPRAGLAGLRPENPSVAFDPGSVYS